MSALENVVNGIGAAGALGMAAYGLVDITKFFNGGVSNMGFGSVRDTVDPYISVGGATGAVFGKDQILATLKANWINGMAKADQKAVARSLIRLQLRKDTARRLAGLAGVNPDHLETAADHIENDEDLTPQDLKAIGAFDVAVSAALDLGYERGDQQYRNAAKFAAAVIAIGFSLLAGWLIFGSNGACGGGPGATTCLGVHWFWVALLVGIVAVPLAPVAKDVSTALQSAVKAIGAFRR